MDLDYDPATRHLPQTDVDALDELDAEAARVREELDWTLAAFVAVFDEALDWLLLVQLGDYTRERYDGNVWSLPGGAVQPTEIPTAAAVRELKEETGLTLSRSDLRPAGWFGRPYYQPHFREQPGELLLLFAAIGNPDDPAVRPNPDETLRAEFVPFNLDALLQVPTRGEGEHPLQPLPRHWAWWAEAAHSVLEDQLRHPTVWTYDSRESLAEPPWSEPPVPSHWQTGLSVRSRKSS